MLTNRKGANEFLKILVKNLKDMQDLEDMEYPDLTTLEKEGWAQVLKDSPIYEKLKFDLDNNPIARMKWQERLQVMFDLITSGISGESIRKIHQKVAFGEFLLKNANACCGTPEQYCSAFWEEFGALCGSGNYVGIKHCPCQVCEEYEGVVIGIHRGLFVLFPNVIGFLLAAPKWMPSPSDIILKDVGDTFEPFLQREEVISSIYQVVKIQTQGGIINLLPKVLFKDGRIAMLMALSFYAHLFVMSHELSHFLLGHTTEAPMTQLELEGQTIKSFAWTNDQKREFQADATGFAIFLNYIYSMGNDLQIMDSIAGVEIVFLICELCEKIGRNPPSMTHPPAKDRRLQLRKKHRFPGNYYGFSDSVVSVGESILEDIEKKYNL